MQTKTYFTTSTFFTTYIDKAKTITKTRTSVRSNIITETYSGGQFDYTPQQENDQSPTIEESPQEKYLSLGPNIYGLVKTLYTTYTYFNGIGIDSREVITQESTSVFSTTSLPATISIAPSPSLPSITPSASVQLDRDTLLSLKQQFVSQQSQLSTIDSVEPSFTATYAPDDIKATVSLSSSTNLKPDNTDLSSIKESYQSELSSTTSKPPVGTDVNVPPSANTLIRPTSSTTAASTSSVLSTSIQSENDTDDDDSSDDGGSTATQDAIAGGLVGALVGGISSALIPQPQPPPSGIQVDLGPVLDAVATLLRGPIRSAIANRRNTAQNTDRTDIEPSRTATLPQFARIPSSDPNVIPVGGYSTSVPARDSQYGFIPLNAPQQALPRSDTELESESSYNDIGQIPQDILNILERSSNKAGDNPIVIDNDKIVINDHIISTNDPHIIDVLNKYEHSYLYNKKTNDPLKIRIAAGEPMSSQQSGPGQQQQQPTKIFGLTLPKLPTLGGGNKNKAPSRPQVNKKPVYKNPPPPRRPPPPPPRRPPPPPSNAKRPYNINRPPPPTIKNKPVQYKPPGSSNKPQYKPPGSSNKPKYKAPGSSNTPVINGVERPNLNTNNAPVRPGANNYIPKRPGINYDTNTANLRPSKNNNSGPEYNKPVYPRPASSYPSVSDNNVLPPPRGPATHNHVHPSVSSYPANAQSPPRGSTNDQGSKPYSPSVSLNRPSIGGQPNTFASSPNQKPNYPNQNSFSPNVNPFNGAISNSNKYPKPGPPQSSVIDTSVNQIPGSNQWNTYGPGQGLSNSFKDNENLGQGHQIPVHINQQSSHSQHGVSSPVNNDVTNHEDSLSSVSEQSKIVMAAPPDMIKHNDDDGQFITSDNSGFDPSSQASLPVVFPQHNSGNSIKIVDNSKPPGSSSSNVKVNDNSNIFLGSQFNNGQSSASSPSDNLGPVSHAQHNFGNSIKIIETNDKPSVTGFTGNNNGFTNNFPTSASRIPSSQQNGQSSTSASDNSRPGSHSQHNFGNSIKIIDTNEKPSESGFLGSNNNGFNNNFPSSGSRIPSSSGSNSRPPSSTSINSNDISTVFLGTQNKQNNPPRNQLRQSDSTATESNLLHVEHNSGNSIKVKDNNNKPTRNNQFGPSSLNSNDNNINGFGSKFPAAPSRNPLPTSNNPLGQSSINSNDNNNNAFGSKFPVKPSRNPAPTLKPVPAVPRPLPSRRTTVRPRPTRRNTFATRRTTVGSNRRTTIRPVATTVSSFNNGISRKPSIKASPRPFSRPNQVAIDVPAFSPNENAVRDPFGQVFSQQQGPGQNRVHHNQHHGSNNRKPVANNPYRSRQQTTESSASIIQGSNQIIGNGGGIVIGTPTKGFMRDVTITGTDGGVAVIQTKYDGTPQLDPSFTVSAGYNPVSNTEVVKISTQDTPLFTLIEPSSSSKLEYEGWLTDGDPLKDLPPLKPATTQPLNIQVVETEAPKTVTYHNEWHTPTETPTADFIPFSPPPPASNFDREWKTYKTGLVETVDVIKPTNTLQYQITETEAPKTVTYQNEWFANSISKSVSQINDEAVPDFVRKTPYTTSAPIRIPRPTRPKYRPKVQRPVGTVEEASVTDNEVTTRRPFRNRPTRLPPTRRPPIRRITQTPEIITGGVRPNKPPRPPRPTPQTYDPYAEYQDKYPHLVNDDDDSDDYSETQHHSNHGIRKKPVVLPVIGDNEGANNYGVLLQNAVKNGISDKVEGNDGTNRDESSPNIKISSDGYNGFKEINAGYPDKDQNSDSYNDQLIKDGGSGLNEYPPFVTTVRPTTTRPTNNRIGSENQEQKRNKTYHSSEYVNEKRYTLKRRPITSAGEGNNDNDDDNHSSQQDNENFLTPTQRPSLKTQDDESDGRGSSTRGEIDLNNFFDNIRGEEKSKKKRKFETSTQNTFSTGGIPTIINNNLPTTSAVPDKSIKNFNDREVIVTSPIGTIDEKTTTRILPISTRQKSTYSRTVTAKTSPIVSTVNLGGGYPFPQRPRPDISYKAEEEIKDDEVLNKNVEAAIVEQVPEHILSAEDQDPQTKCQKKCGLNEMCHITPAGDAQCKCRPGFGKPTNLPGSKCESKLGNKIITIANQNDMFLNC